MAKNEKMCSEVKHEDGHILVMVRKTLSKVPLGRRQRKWSVQGRIGRGREARGGCR